MNLCCLDAVLLVYKAEPLASHHARRATQRRKVEGAVSFFIRLRWPRPLFRIGLRFSLDIGKALLDLAGVHLKSLCQHVASNKPVYMALGLASNFRAFFG